MGLSLFDIKNDQVLPLLSSLDGTLNSLLDDSILIDLFYFL